MSDKEIVDWLADNAIIEALGPCDLYYHGLEVASEKGRPLSLNGGGPTRDDMREAFRRMMKCAMERE